MSLFDDRGRLFGRLNLIDAAAALLVLALIPLAYASWLLFRAKPPSIDSITPAVVTVGQPSQHIEVRGRHLRPFLRAWVGSAKAGYLFDSADRAVVDVPALAPGTYDLALFDSSRELVRFPGAVTVKAAPAEKLVEAELVVRFVTRPEVLEEAGRAISQRAAADLQPTASRPVLVSCEVTDSVTGATPADKIQGRLDVARCIVRVVASRTGDGWQAHGFPLKVGAGFGFSGETYQLQGGQILKVTVTNASR
jgi:hypothetical protein